MPADTTTADAFAAGQREAREADRVALVTALGLPAGATWGDVLAAAADASAHVSSREEGQREAFAYAATYIEGASIPLPLSAWSGTKKELVATFALKLAGEVRNLRGEPRMWGGDASPTGADLYPAEAILPLHASPESAASRYSAASDAGIAREGASEPIPSTIYDVEGDL